MKDWSQYLPNDIPQYLKQDTLTCTNHAAINCIETQEFAITGLKNQYSRRWLAKVSNTSPTQGNSEQVVFPAVAKYGLVLESSWPQRNDMTDAEYYADPTPEQRALLLAEGQVWLQKWEISYDFFKQLTDLDKAPLIVRANLFTTFHFMEVLNPQLYYDSEYHNGHIGVINPSVYNIVGKEYSQIIIKRKEQTMKLVNNNNTYYVEGDKGYLGINHVEFLQELLKITDQIEARPPVGTQIGVVETSPAGFIIKQN